ncbi:MAG: cytochrome P450 [Acidimicrobiia bacterium]|nr:cytochrome P450 [Acidimicrobiia bacterium]
MVTDISLEQLTDDPHRTYAELRREGPIVWIESLGGWVVLTRELAIEVMRDADTFTVDHPGFTTAQVVGPSMLSLDGPEHRRHRDPFVDFFRLASLRRRFAEFLETTATARVAQLRSAGSAELREGLAGPFAVDVVAELLGMVDIDPIELLALYRDIVGAVTELSAGQPMPTSGPAAVAELRSHVAAATDGQGMVADVARSLSGDEVLSNAAVMLFGGIETSEGMNAGALWYLLTERGLLEAALEDKDVLSPLVEEALRLEPAAARVDRFATRGVTVAGASIAKDDLVIVSLAAANRDPLSYDAPDEFRLDRAEDAHVAFALGPHVCMGQHLARMETVALLSAVLDGLPSIQLDRQRSTAPTGLVFRKPAVVAATWVP